MLIFLYQGVWINPGQIGQSLLILVMKLIQKDGRPIIKQQHLVNMHIVFQKRTRSEKSDIFKTKIPDRFRPNAVMLVKGKVINYKTMAPLESKINFSIIPDGDEAGYTSSNPVSGSFRIDTTRQAIITVMKQWLLNLSGPIMILT